MIQEHRGRNHVLHLYCEDEAGEGPLSIQVFHPEECRQVKVYAGLVGEYNCDIAHHIREWGLDLHLADVPAGLYMAQYWVTPSGWAGANPIDAKDGIDLAELILNEDRVWPL